ncbi:alpha/beta hydrolase [Candidatus Gracilibacteria bacterium]|nr:alpha/beta hydrolase [Candidatus Gracilibacteria bacterium]
MGDEFVSARCVDVWCPPSYTEDADQRHPVIYMHDGQNLFDPQLAFGGVDWGIASAMQRVVRAAALPGAIVVGIWNSPQRRREYMPEQFLHTSGGQKRLAELRSSHGGEPLADAYLRFLVDVVKPFVDTNYRTLPDAAHTSVMGSSMGGLISLYALAEYPAVFRAAACVSTHWPAGETSLVEYFAAVLPPAGSHRLYFDYGTEGLDAAYEPFQLQMDEHLRRAGYTYDADWMTLKFPGTGHSESAWRARVHLPLAFLLK